MIPNNSSVAVVENTLVGERVEMEVSPEDMAPIMAVLSEIYTSPVNAIVREYTTNAIDSHIEAGQTRPVEVTTPNAFNPNLIIQDFGIGMDADDIRNVYSKYGASTKRSSDAVTGMLGIGSKSAFAYSNSFTVTGIKNGVRVVVAVSRDEDGGGSMVIVDESKTDKHNGVTITIPVHDRWAIESAAREFCKFLPKGVVLLDGREPSVRDNWTHVASNIVSEDGEIEILNIWENKAGTYADSRVIMGNVAYEPNSHITPTSHYYNAAVIVEVSMGAVVFAPSREKLMDVRKTRKLEEFARESYADIRAKDMLDEIAACPTAAEARQKFLEHANDLSALGIDTVQYNGEDIPKASAFAIYRPGAKAARSCKPKSEYRPNDVLTAVSYKLLEKAPLVVFNAPDKALTPIFRRRLEFYCEQNGIHLPEYSYSGEDTVILFMEDDKDVLNNKWIKVLPNSAEWDDIKDLTLPRHMSVTTGGGISTKGKHFVIEANGTRELREIEDDEQIYYLHGREVREDWDLRKFTGYWKSGKTYDDDAFTRFSRVAARVIPADHILIDVYRNRTERFLKDYPQAKPLTESMLSDMLGTYWEAQVTQDVIASAARSYALAANSGFSMALKDFIPDADPDKEPIFGINEVEFATVVEHVAKYGDGKALSDKIAAERAVLSQHMSNILTRYPIAALVRQGGAGIDLNRYFEADYQMYLNTQEEEV